MNGLYPAQGQGTANTDDILKRLQAALAGVGYSGGIADFLRALVNAQGERRTSPDEPVSPNVPGGSTGRGRLTFGTLDPNMPGPNPGQPWT